MGERSAAHWRVPVPPWTRATLWASLVAVVLYIGGWVVAGWWRTGYDPRQQAISELFELGAPWASRGPLVLGLVASGLAFLALAPALHRTLPGEGVAGPVLVAIAGIGTLGVVAAPCTPGCPGAATSSFDLWHTITAGVGYTALVSAPLAFAWRLRAVAPSLARWSVAIGGLAAAAFAVHVLGVRVVAAGVAQRVFNTVADLWYVLIVIQILVRDAAARQRPSVASTRAGGDVHGQLPGAG